MVTESDGAGNGDDTGTAKSDPFNTIEIAKGNIRTPDV